MSRIDDFVRDDKKLLLGVVHLRPLPGSPRHAEPVEAIVDAARQDADTILQAGFDGFVIENFGDVPFFAGSVPAEVIACMTRVACELPTRHAFTVANVLRNDATGALAVAAAADLDAVRVNVHCGAMVTDQGVVEGRAAETLRLRRKLALSTDILADVAVKHAAPLALDYRLEDIAKDTAYRGLADALIVTGPATGATAALEDVERVKAAVDDRPVIVGSGVNESNVASLLQIADGAIVASSLKRDGVLANPIDLDRAKRFVECAR